MSLFKWSTPERRNADRVLPIVPNEIYLYLFEHIAPPTRRLTPEEIRIFTNLSCVCRFFANVCLPRLFEYLEFCGDIFRDDTPPRRLRNDTRHKASRESAFCTQLSKKQPLALALARMVKVCHFIDWKLDDAGAWAVRLFANKYLSGMMNMTHLRTLKFSNSFVETEHWIRIAALTSLQELSFDWCRFLHGPADVEPERRGNFKVKVPRVRVVNCSGVRHVVAAIDVPYIRALTMDFLLFDQVGWLSESALTEIRLCRPASWVATPNPYVERLHTFLVQAPRSLEMLGLFLDVSFELAQDFMRTMFDHAAWRNLRHLRSLTLQVRSRNSSKPAEVLSMISEGVNLLTDLQSFTLKASVTPEISTTEMQHILQEKLGRTSNLKNADIYGKVFRSVDGDWLEVLSRTT